MTNRLQHLQVFNGRLAQFLAVEGERESDCKAQ